MSPTPSNDASRYQAATKRAQTVESALKVVMWILLLSGSIVFMIPLYLMVAMALKSPEEIAKTTAWEWPK